MTEGVVPPCVEAARVSGVVLDSGGRPAAGISVGLLDEESGQAVMQPQEGFADEGGRFSIVWVPPGRYRVFGRSPAPGVVLGEPFDLAEGSERSERLRFDPSALLRVEAAGEDGKVAAIVRASVLDRSGIDLAPLAGVATGKGSSFEISLPPGPYLVSVEDVDGRLGSRECAAVAGKLTESRIPLAPR